MVVELFTELRRAVRTMVRSPGFTFVTVFTLAVGIGANTALFSVVRGVLLEPLPFDRPDELMVVHATRQSDGGEFGSASAVALAFEEGVPLERSAAYMPLSATLRVGDVVERVRAASVTADFFTTLGVEPLLGRLPARAELQSERNAGNQVVISHALWANYLGGDPDVVGRSVEIAERMRTVAAVMPPEFRFPENATSGRGSTMAWLPFAPDWSSVSAEDWMWGLVVRVSPGSRPENLASRLAPVAQTLPERFPSVDFLREGRYRPVVRSLHDMVVGDLEPMLWTLLGAAGFVLLIAAANVTNLFLARAESRQAELAVRAALGAGRARLMRAQLAETVVLAAAAAVLAVVLAVLSTPLLLRAVPGGLTRAYNVGMSPEVLAFTALLALATGLLIGLVPALRRPSSDLAGRVRSSGRGTLGSRQARMTRNALVVAESALALVLLVGSGLLVRSAWNLQNVDPGYETRDVLTFQVAPRPGRYRTSTEAAAFHRTFMERIAALPGVESVGTVGYLPLFEDLAVGNVVIEDRAASDGAVPVRIPLNFASAGYFRTMGIALLEGRDFLGTDDPRDRGAVIVSRSVAERYWPGRSPVGERLRGGSDLDVPMEVVGVVEDVREEGRRSPPTDLIYLPFVAPQCGVDDCWVITSPSYTVKAREPDRLAPLIRAELRAVEPTSPMYWVQTMAFLAARDMASLSFTMLALLVSAGMALLLGAVGLYGVLSYMVSQRTREIGIRIALGARRNEVRRMTVIEGVRIVAFGLALGLLGAAVLTRLLSGLLHEVEPLDPPTYIVVTACMLGVGVLASWVPAQRASSVDPMRSMRVE